MPREELLDYVVQLLREAGYEIARQYAPSCFDVLAKRRNILLVKVLSNIDSLYEEQADDLKRISSVLEATPLLIGQNARSEPMRPHTVYERHGIVAVSLETFEDTIREHKFPFLYAKKGGFYAHMNADFLKKVREKQKISLGDLSREAGVSKSTIQNYEQGAGAEVENIMRLQETLGDLVLDPINLFDFEEKNITPAKTSPAESKINSRLGDIGFNVTTVTKASFRLAGRHKDDILLAGLEKQSLQKKARDIHEVTDTLGQHGMFVLDQAKEKRVEGVPILEHEELKEVVTSKELLKLLKELAE